jgi:hypothetical protein
MDRGFVTWLLSFLVVAAGLGALVYIFLRKRGLAKRNALWLGVTIAFVLVLTVLSFLIYRAFQSFEF